MKRLFHLFLLCACIAMGIQAADPGQYSDKRFALLGDSMTWIGGDSCQNTRGWTYHFKRALQPAAIDVYARSGATWTNTSETVGDTLHYSEVITPENVIISQVYRLIGRVSKDAGACPDIILIYAGTNDAWFPHLRPGIFDSAAHSAGSRPGDNTSLSGSIRLACDTLREAFPDSRIVLVSPVEMSKVTPDHIKKVSDIIQSTGDSLHIEVFRADRDVNIRHAVESVKPTLTADGVHTNPKGAEIIGNYIVSKLLK